MKVERVLTIILGQLAETQPLRLLPNEKKTEECTPSKQKIGFLVKTPPSVKNLRYFIVVGAVKQPEIAMATNPKWRWPSGRATSIYFERGERGEKRLKGAGGDRTT